MSLDQRHLKLGTVGRALGLQGSFFVSARDEAIPLTVTSVLIGRSLEQAREAKVLSRGWQNRRPTLKCSLANNRTEAELLVGFSIWVEDRQIKVEDASEYLISDMMGRSVIDHQGALMGTVVQIINMPASLNLIVQDVAKTAHVDVPMTPEFVQMNFVRGGKDLHLNVPASYFEDIWNPIKPK